MITDGLWAAMEPLVNQAKRHKGGQPPVLPDRMFFEAVLYIARTGIPLRDLPGGVRGVGRRVQPVPPLGRLGRDGPAVRGDDRRPAVRRGPAGARRLDQRPRPPARRRGGAERKAPRGGNVGAAARARAAAAAG